MDNKPPFDTDFDKELFRIEIIACKGGHKISVTRIGDNPHASYQEIIGALEIMKQKVVWDQMEANRDAGKKYDKDHAKKSKKKPI